MRDENKPKSTLVLVTEDNLVSVLKSQLDFVQENGIELSVLAAVEKNKYQRMAHLSSFAYLRIYASDYFTSFVKKVIYFDVDCWIKHDLSDLFEIDLGNKLGGAAPEFTSSEDKKRLDLEESDLYLNTGLFLINLELWRLESIESKFFNCYNEIKHKLKWADQDVFNVLFKDRWFLLDPQYNLMRQYQYEFKVIHFNTGSKPWDFRDENFWSRKYVNFRMEFEKDWLPDAINWRELIQMGIRVWRGFVVDIRFIVKCSYRYLLRKIN
jgi:lipopolysaccharide biosynthesis glycosyltransferase